MLRHYKNFGPGPKRVIAYYDCEAMQDGALNIQPSRSWRRMVASGFVAAAAISVLIWIWMANRRPPLYTPAQSVKLVSWLSAQHDDDELLTPLRGHISRAALTFFAETSDTRLYEIEGLKLSQVAARIHWLLLKQGLQRMRPPFSTPDMDAMPHHFYSVEFYGDGPISYASADHVSGSPAVYLTIEREDPSGRIYRSVASRLGFDPNRTGYVDLESALVDWPVRAQDRLFAVLAAPDAPLFQSSSHEGEPWMAPFRRFVKSSSATQSQWDGERIYVLGGLPLSKVVASLDASLKPEGFVRTTTNIDSDKDLDLPGGGITAEYTAKGWNPKLAATGLIQVAAWRPPGSADVQIRELYGRPVRK